jgi:uncharacterized protein DUF4038/collagenase-like protein with putative collagen-binding domain
MQGFHYTFSLSSTFRQLGSFACVALLVACGNGDGESTPTSAPVPTSTGLVYPLKIGPTSRYLVDQKGEPFLLVGDAAWSLIGVLSDSDSDFYLENRKQLGFTAVIVSLIEHTFAPKAPANFYGITPFIGQPFVTPNESYFAHADYIVKSAAAKGIVILLDPLYLGFGCGSQGWCREVQAATTSQLMVWGQYVGNRYKNFDNIIWMIGGDTDPSPVKDKVQAMVDGIRSMDSRHLFTAHNNVEQMAVTPWAGADWLTLNNVYTYSGIAYRSMMDAYSLSPPMPVFLVEAWYENEHGVTESGLRAQSYWTVLSGGFGHVFGNCPIWAFGFANTCTSKDWKAALNDVGSMGMRHFQALFKSRHWHTLVPDTTQNVLTAGYGTFGTVAHARAACAADGSSILAYLPSSLTAQSGSVTVNGSCLNAKTMMAWWYDPSTGMASRIATYSTSGALTLSPPSSDRDWVLVLDSANYSFPPPGQ